MPSTDFSLGRSDKLSDMSTSPILIVPGFQGSGPAHWQTWLQAQISGSTRITGSDWDKPVLAHWAERVRDELARAAQPVQVIAKARKGLGLFRGAL